MKFYFIATLLLLTIKLSSPNRCSRDGSKIVRNVIRFKLWDIYKEHGTQMPISCPFALEREIYYQQEKNKIMETFNKWKCDFCGKAFLAESFLDKHFDRRHPDSIQQSSSSVCLSDYCDVYRCDVLSGSRKPDFWDVALCIEDDIVEIQEKCKAQMNQCIPIHLSENATNHIKGQLYETVCSFLTCSKFWDVPVPPSDSAVAMYIIMSILITFSVLVYYCLFYQYYFTDMFSDNITYDPILKQQYHNYHMTSPKGQLRQRSRQGDP